MASLRLLVAGGNEIAQRGLCALIREQPDWEVVAQARDGREAVERTRHSKPDVVIMDVDMASLNGLDATRQIAKDAIETKVLLLAPRDVDELLPQALEAGARGYLLKSATANDLISAVEALRRGRSFFSARGRRNVVDGYLKKIGKAKRVVCKHSSRLTTREREVVQLIAEGHCAKQVGTALYISTATAETHRANIMKKTGCHSVADLVRYAIRHNIIEP